MPAFAGMTVHNGRHPRESGDCRHGKEYGSASLDERRASAGDQKGVEESPHVEAISAVALETAEKAGRLTIMGSGLFGASNHFVRENLGAPPPKYRLGLWLNYRKLASAAYVPNRFERAKLRNGIPCSIVIDWVLASEQTLEFRGISPGFFWIDRILTSSLLPEGARAMLYDPQRKRAFTDQPISLSNLGGDAKEPFFLKQLYPLNPNSPILARVTNLAKSINRGQIVLPGNTVSGPLPQIPVGSEASAAAGSSRQLVEKPAWIDRPGSAEPFFPASFIVLPAVGATAPIIDFQVPQGRSGVINRIANEFVGGAWVNGDGNLIWQIVVNGSPVKNCESIVASLGTVANPSAVDPIRLHENDIVQLTIRNVAVPAAGQLVGGRLQGYYYPKELDPENLW
jgi:hypothetical protein